MKKLFKKSRLLLDEVLQDIYTFTKDVYGQVNSVYTSASPWGQIMTVLAKHSQLMLYYIEDSITELNINTASRPQSIRGLARLAGHNITRAISATGDIVITPNGNNSNLNDGTILIPNFTKLICKDNQLPYLLVLGKDEIKYNIFTDRKPIQCRVIQGELETQTFTGTGFALQSFEANMISGEKIDNFFVNVYVNGTKWKKYDSLYDIPKDSNGYLVKTGITSGIDIYFGNGFFGKIPELGSIITVEYLLTAGSSGNISDINNISLEFDNSGYDELGNELDLNNYFNVRVALPITFGSDTETTQLTRMLAPKTSRSFVLANTENYINFFEKFQYFSYINVYTEYNEKNWFIDNIIYILLVPDIKKRMKYGENYFTVNKELFKLTNLEKYKIQKLLDESGQKIVNAVVRFIDPVFKQYALNININKWSGYNKDSLYETIISKLSEYMVTFKRKDYLPKSDLIALIENIDGVDSVNISFISEDVELELQNILNKDNISKSNILTDKDKELLITFYSQNTSLTNDQKLLFIYNLESFKTFYNTYLDSNGDIILDKHERFIFRGGWYDRYNIYYTDELDKNKNSCININFIKEIEKNN